MLTKNGIELNLFQSKYIFKYRELEFYFSSMFYFKKFENELQNYIDMETKKFYNKYNINIKLEEVFAISLYKKIEKRGFLVYYKKEQVLKDDEFSVDIY